MKLTLRARVAGLALVAALAIGCAGPLEDEEVIEMEDAITSLSGLFDDPKACARWLDPPNLWLRWYGPHNCGVYYPRGICAALFDEQCTSANPRFESFLERICWFHCEPVDPPPPPTCADCANRPPGAPPWAWGWCACCQNGQIVQPCYVAYKLADGGES